MPAVRIHCWGGFGSQLFAILQYWNLQRRFPGRKLVLVIHTSGVTRRDIETESLLRNIPFKVVDDFERQRGPTTKQLKSSSKIEVIKAKLYILPKVLMKTTGLLSDLENTKAYDSIKPWLLTVRGHYTRYPFSSADLLKLYEVISSIDSEDLGGESMVDVLTIQYRLGDLLNLSNKGFVDSKLLSDIANSIVDKSHISNTILLTDSPAEAMQLLDTSNRNWKVANLSPISTIKLCVDSSEFIGSNSKISFWITVFRALMNKESHITEVFQEKLKMLTNQSQSSRFIFYKDETKI
jgi:hypothetical protein